MPTQATLGPIPLALTEDGATITFDHRRDGHLLIHGPSGSGKSATLKAIAARATRGAQVWICDPLQSDVGRDAWPTDVDEVATTLEAIAMVIHNTHHEMERRYQALTSGAVSSDELEPIFVVLDEPRLLGSHADVEHALKQLDRKVEAIARQGRAAKVHLIVGTSHIPPQVLNALPLQCRLGPLTPEDATNSWGFPFKPWTPHEQLGPAMNNIPEPNDLGQGPGTGVARTPDGRMFRIRVLLEDEQI